MRVNIFTVILLAVVFSGCVIFSEGTKVSDNKEINFKQLLSVLARGEIKELPEDITQEIRGIKDENVKNAIDQEYHAINTNSGDRYLKNDVLASEENKRVILDYLNAKLKSYKLDNILAAYGNPAFYECQKNSNKITLYYMYENSFMLSLAIISFGSRNYSYHRFVFEVDPEDAYGSPLISCKEGAYTGKFYGLNQPSIYELLNSMSNAESARSPELLIDED